MDSWGSGMCFTCVIVYLNIVVNSFPMKPVVWDEAEWSEHCESGRQALCDGNFVHLSLPVPHRSLSVVSS